MLWRLIRHLFGAGRTPAPGGMRMSGSRVDGDSGGGSPAEWLRRGEALEAQGDPGGALECYRACVAAHPSDVKARLAVTNALAAVWRVEECIQACAEALEAAPLDRQVFSGLLLYSHYAANPEPQALFELHRRYGKLMAGAVPPQYDGLHRNAPDPDRLLRIGYVSRNFSLHSVGYFVEPAVACHDRGRHRIYCYYTHTHVDETTQRIAQLADVWRHVHAESDEALAARIFEDEIDVLVDLGGHTKLNRLAAFARKPAPVQMTWLGYPDTTGLSSIDYRITDATVDPSPSADPLCTERVLRLDSPFLCYQPPADSPPIATRTPRETVTFGSFNVLLKVNAPLIGLWARILEAVPGSRMLIKAGLLANDEVVLELTDRFVAAGIDAHRLELRGWATARTGHLETYNEIDIALDTFPYNGTTTTCEALWMGVPVVTLKGDTHVSRVGATLLASVGLNELVATHADAYVQIAVGLARDPARRIALRESMRRRLRASSLLDHAGFTRRLEAAYRQAWKTWCGTRAVDASLESAR